MPENGSHQNSAKLLKNSSKTPHPHPPGWREEFRENCLFSCVKRKLLTNSSPQTPHKLLTNSSQTPRPFLVQIRPKLRKKIEAKSRIGNNFYGKRRFFKKNRKGGLASFLAWDSSVGLFTLWCVAYKWPKQGVDQAPNKRKRTQF